MIGRLLVQLSKAIPAFLAYKVSEAFGRKRTVFVPPTGGLDGARAADPVLSQIGLDPRLARTTPWLAEANPFASAELEKLLLFKLWLAIPEGHKWSQYFYAYTAVFGLLRERPLRILELGVFYGSSLSLWRGYFLDPDTVIVGIDVEPVCVQSENPAANIYVRIGSQADTAFLDRVVEEFGPFDIIIDDGSHQSSHMITSFNHLFEAGLKDDGIYLVEDLHANYWSPYRDSELSFIDLCKQMVDLIHLHYTRQGVEGIGSFWHGREQQLKSIDVAYLTTTIREIRFFDSVVAITKKATGYVPSLIRTV
jgi:hypothetical protein